MQTGEVADHPLAISELPIKRRLPLLLINLLPTSRMPPAKILIATGVHELEIVAVCHQRAIDQKVLQKYFVPRLLVIESERRERKHHCLRFAGITVGVHPLATPSGSVTEFEQPAFNRSHAADCVN